MEEKKLEYQRQAIDAINRAIAWCRQVGIEINVMMRADNNLMILASDQIVVDNDELKLREDIPDGR